jgi:hypothetical protein
VPLTLKQPLLNQTLNRAPRTLAVQTDRRLSLRTAVPIPATLEAFEENDLRYRGTILNLTLSSCLLRLPSTQRFAHKRWEIVIESPMGDHSLATECAIIGVMSHRTAEMEDVGLRFVNPPKGFQESIVSFQSNLSRLLSESVKVRLSAILLVQEGRQRLENTVPIVEMGGAFITIMMKEGGLVVSQQLLTRILSPDFREELRAPATVTSVERVTGGQRVRLTFESWDGGRLAFAKRHVVKPTPQLSRWTPKITASIYGRSAPRYAH